VSGGVYASLNCGYGSGDDVELVRENRARVARDLGADEGRLLTVYQIHSADAVVVDAPWSREDAPHADGMATSVRGIALGVLAADCAPVLFADPEAGVIGSAHAGWQGAFKGVIESVIRQMEALGARRGAIRACVGPCISQTNYEVGPEFVERILAETPAHSAYFVPSTKQGHSMFDLPSFVMRRLEQSGVGRAETLATCTYANDDGFFSFRRTTHRKESAYGRNMSAIMLV
jgi:YfiH family protein